MFLLNAITVHRYGWSALHYAAIQGQFEIVELLLARGIDVRARDKDGVTAAYRARAAGHHDVVCLILSVVNSNDLLIVQLDQDDDDRTRQSLYANVRKSTATQNTTSQFGYMPVWQYMCAADYLQLKLTPRCCPFSCDIYCFKQEQF